MENWGSGDEGQLLPDYIDAASVKVMQVPEPSTMLLLGIGLIGLASAAVRRKIKHKPDLHVILAGTGCSE